LAIVGGQPKTPIVAPIVYALLQAKMAQQGTRMRVGVREGFAYHSVELVSVANGNKYEVDSKAFLSPKW
jgi:hypothetical protein